MNEVGRIREIYRYPVKSMAGEALKTADLGWHGIEGDRRLAFVRSGIRAGFPWLTASKLPSLITYHPLRSDGELLPSRVRTPSGEELPLDGDALRDEIGRAHGAPVSLMELRSGIFDDATVSIITSAAIQSVSAEAEVPVDVRRFRPNFVIETADGRPFPEDEWVGKTLRIGGAEDGAVVSVSMRDVRCMMLNLDPETAVQDPRLLKATVRLNQNCAGVYATVTRIGRVSVGEPVFLAS